MAKIQKADIERACRLYHSNEDAARAIGIKSSSLSRICQRHDVETPYARKQRLRRESKDCGQGKKRLT